MNISGRRLCMAEKEKEMTIVDVAREAGVSIATVSNVLNRRKVPMAAETIRKVEAAAAFLGYRRNTVAASLSRRKTYELGLLVPSFSSFHGGFAEAMEQAAHDRGYHLSVYSTKGSPESEERHIEKLLQRRVDGLFTHGLAMSHDAVRRMVRGGTPIVLYNAWDWPEDLAVGSVNSDIIEACSEMVTHLYERGCRRLVYLGFKKAKTTDLQRRIGFQAGINKLLEPIPSTIVEIETRSDPGWTDEAASLIMEGGGPVGFLAFDDRIAYHTITEFRRKGIEVPSQAKIAGINNEWYGEAGFPSLTSMGNPHRKHAALAVGMMVDHLETRGTGEGGPTVAKKITVPLPLFFRESTEG